MEVANGAGRLAGSANVRFGRNPHLSLMSLYSPELLLFM
jgi:hypothetical protein